MRLWNRMRNWFQRASLLQELPLLLVLALVASFIIKTFVAQAFFIPSGSMEATLFKDDRVVVSKMSKVIRGIQRGDIVVFRDPGGWLDQETTTGAGVIRRGLTSVGLLPDLSSEFLIKRVIGVGGDHVRCCNDQGRILLNGRPLYEPYLSPRNKPSQIAFEVVVPKDSYWVMGDHRDASEDSRYHQDDGRNGMVPSSDVIGRAEFLVWPLSHAKRL
jgi:signal peptidase I